MQLIHFTNVCIIYSTVYVFTIGSFGADSLLEFKIYYVWHIKYNSLYHIMVYGILDIFN